MASRVGNKYSVNNESESITKMSAEDKGNTGIKEHSGDREFEFDLTIDITLTICLLDFVYIPTKSL